MKVKVLGYRDVNMTDKETGRLIVGTSLHVCYPNDGVKGLETRKIFFSSDRMRDMKYVPVPDTYANLEFGPSGKAYSIVALNDK